jgi:hypothetical protein
MGDLSFTSPAVLIALIALPAIWFALRATPPAPQQIKFPAFEILRRLSKTTETPQKTPWWLILLRVAVAGIAIIAIAGPVMNAAPAPATGGPLVIVADNSWMAAPGWRLRRDAMRALGEQAAAADREVYFIASVPEFAGPVEPMTGEQFIKTAGDVQPLPLQPDYGATLARVRALQSTVSNANVIWLTDGVEHPGAADLTAALRAIGELAVYVDDETPLLALNPPSRSDAGLTYEVSLIRGGTWKGDIVALGRGGRELARTEIEIGAGKDRAAATLDLPLALQNDVALARIDGAPSAGAVQLVDARDRRALIGFLASGEANVDPLLAGQHYVRQALAPFATFATDTLDGLIRSEVSVIVLDDVGVIRESDAQTLRSWVEKGGVVIRFAGPSLGEAAEDGTPLLLPVKLRGGGRAFGGALTWETPQRLGGFSVDGPFAGLAPPEDVFVRRQVLAEPGGETSDRTWASLADGTPLVTGETIGAGAVALFHVTATPEWSDLPLSVAFIEMLRKLAFMSQQGASAQKGEDFRVAAFRVLDGYGALRQPARDLEPATLAEISAGPAPGRPPGFYGASEAPIALNAVNANDKFAAFNAGGAHVSPYVANPPVKFGPPFFVIALLLLIADGVIALRLAGKLAFFGILIFSAVFIAPHPAAAQPLDRPISAAAEEAALSMRLAWVKTGDPATDRISEAGLSGLTRQLALRTSSEPAAPLGVDPETDDLSVYPFLYWPVIEGAAAPSAQALANIETFMRFGGLIVFDTRDDERAIAGVETPEGAALKTILSELDLPPLAPIGPDHVLTRSFYLLADLPGRTAVRPVWAQAGEGPNDSVTPLIIGGRDWAGAWASDNVGEPLLPIRTGARPCTSREGAIPRNPRECAYRAGVNMVMVALTGNYKSDQVHTPILLERLGRE